MFEYFRPSHPGALSVGSSFGAGVGAVVIALWLLGSSIFGTTGIALAGETGEAALESAPDTEIFPQQLPTFKMLDESQVAVPSSRLDGKVVLLDFWASWCRPCRFTLPELERIHLQFGDREDFAVVGLAIDEGRAGGVRARKFAAKARVTYAIYHDNSSKPAKPQFNIEVVPALFLVGTDGKILRRWDGEPDMSEVEAAVKAALGVETDK